jgi:hypothetical protein
MDPFAIHTTLTHVCKLIFDAASRPMGAGMRELDKKESEKTEVEKCRRRLID